MAAVKFIAMPTVQAIAFRAGGLDANGQKPERHVSDGSGNPCRHCLRDIPKCESFLILSYRPFDALQPYAEAGPIFLCARECERHAETDATPALFLARERYLLRGYGENDRIVYGTGRSAPSGEIAAAAGELLERQDIAYVHLRSASYNCYQCRIERAG